ncbi:MAG: GNAT family N-acetyltransferase, partial [Patescibacteria group bacterium]|nr:GNAT family N-acetyltransferase [Patescibacteria group bacterium]
GTDMTISSFIELFNRWLQVLRDNTITRVIYKCIPYIYHQAPTQEDLYCLFLHKASLIRRDVTTVIDLTCKIPQQHGKKYSSRKAAKAGIVIEKSNDYHLFWPLLEKVLKEKYNKQPVHTLEEIKTLAFRFPQNIHLFLAYHQSVPLAGTVIYENKTVSHVQYMANSSEGLKIRALDFLLNHLIQEVYSNKKYFDFGISNEHEGRYLNSGLAQFKEGFGGRTVVHEFYEINVS